MTHHSLSRRLKRGYIELEGEDFNSRHFQQNKARYLKIMDFILPFPSAAKALDIGCGFCYLARFLKQEGFEVLAVDFF